ncbi:UDP-N-acetylglucosamine 2-epimerase [Magnetospirillum fulvum]|uniref:UDP-N-acetylglucosamine 2-epimerase n=1 Tax=Magnetospirillum fulvum MGU-K5 TaxID=1316936 RepID=S9TPL4_MAGFU|nr:UDP-N-acetylglucosamine 2-epimerase [Magnetospirillum fulvum]EPY00515.1 UDP-N-acetylglucosamine 2-epimerase [Magnetospirillum fulvum MGU-K5]
MNKRKICIVVGSRANYSSIKSVMQAVKDHPDLELQLVVGASAILDRYGNVADLIERDGFKAAARVFMLVEGETPTTMAKSTGLGLIELPMIFESLAPDVVLTVGDRFETMATTLAAAYMNIPLAHTMGGEVSGNIDENIRHAISKFANIHFPACEDARQRIIRMGENPDTVHNTGCPRIDLVAEYLKSDRCLDEALFGQGVGIKFTTDEDFILVSQHPVTGEYGCGETQIGTTLRAVRDTGLPAIVLWPNADAGSEDVARGIRKFRERDPDAPFYYVKNLPIEVYVLLMARTRCLVGNSSSAIREGAFIGTPSVNIGTRQTARQHGRNVINCDYNATAIADAIADRLALRGRLPSEPIYGDGKAGPRIAHLLATEPLTTAKMMTY